MKKTISIILAFVLTFVLFGCGKAAKSGGKDHLSEFLEMTDLL